MLEKIHTAQQELKYIYIYVKNYFVSIYFEQTRAENTKIHFIVCVYLSFFYRLCVRLYIFLFDVHRTLSSAFRSVFVKQLITYISELRSMVESNFERLPNKMSIFSLNLPFLKSRERFTKR